MDLEYKIIFLSDWHCGSGLSSGADMDLLVIKDEDNLPFVPGKTIKGLVKEAMEEINRLKKAKLDTSIDTFLGISGDDKASTTPIGSGFFSNAELRESMKLAIVEQKLSRHLYRGISSTAINDSGITQDASLRQLEVTIPLELEGTIENIPADLEDLVQDALKFIKQLGYNRNRGLGKCIIEIIKENRS